jgi:hypothetical protein
MKRSNGVKTILLALIVFSASLFLYGATPHEPTTKCPKSLSSQGKLSDVQAVSQKELDALAKQFMDYCSSTPGIQEDSRVIKLSSTWNKSVLLSDFPGEKSSVMGTFNKQTGCLLMRDLKDVKTLGEQLGIMLHELAHSNGFDHDDTWRDCFLYFINVATQKLGWIVSLKCPTSCKNYQVCEKSQCELCDWVNFESCAKK